MFTKENLVELLKNNVVTVTFTKVDGTERTMKCTLLGEYVPAPTQGKQLLQENNGSDSNISVWDTEVSGWRSFRISNVKSVTVG